MDEFMPSQGLNAGSKEIAQIVRPTLTAHLEQEQSTLEARLAEVKEAISALKANPEIERVLNLVGKVKSRY